MKDTELEARRRIDEEEDFVYAKRFDNSLRKVLAHYPEGAPPRVVARALLMTEEEVEEVYANIVAKMRAVLAPDID